MLTSRARTLIVAAPLLLPASLLRAEQTLLPIGAVAPDVEGKNAEGAPVKLSTELHNGRFAIVYFYPKDETPGCTKEACAFRDAYDKFVKAGVTIFAVSRDSEESHRGFRAHYKLPFPMVADPSGAVQRAYRVPGEAVAQRVSFLVAPDGKVARVWPKVDPVQHANEVLEAVATVKGKRPPH
jgi:peroxiredoxin Q/BCP